ncbi:MgtC/SapB family protein [Candidatus Methanocrinis natronophilus]|uniref:MgtC/SapB family protein n=1 Tax=Candidatus Methanocrinis natronophilus TaxID=3033396 RepID=A0ABT5X9F7_9EURY|nr:MgtC/SapB family protein [Candidatus Methanocrinis natronophilus]MDF0591207.1 MgtC/SapB family protein [Candidatus Methanocrinis natronophilus]
MDLSYLRLEAIAFSDLYPFLISILIGALIGTERERDLLEKKKRGVAGLRTFILISLLGTISAHLAAVYGTAFIIIAFASFALMVAVGYAASATNLGRLDFTSEVAAVIAFTLGALCYSPETAMLSIALAILVTAILAVKKTAHRYVETIRQEELLDTLKMATVALVILPLLPNVPLDPLGVLNPRNIWLMVVLVSLIGFVGYFMIRIFGTDKGLTITGALGGLVSSTAVATTMAAEARAHREVIPSAVFATTIASCTMFPRILLEVFVVNRALFFPLLIPMASMTAVGVAMALLIYRKRETIETKVELSDPFRLSPALKFGAFFAFVLLVSKVATTSFGDAGTYAASVVAGLADVDAITLSLATLARTSQMDEGVAVAAITLAAITNTLVKLGITFILGSKEFGLRVATIFVPIIGVGLLAILFLLL